MKLPINQYDSIISGLEEVIAHREGRVALETSIYDEASGKVVCQGKQFTTRRATPAEVWPMRRAIIRMRLVQALHTVREQWLSVVRSRYKK